MPPGIAGPTQLIVGDWERDEIDRDLDGDGVPAQGGPGEARDRPLVRRRSDSAALDLLVLASLVRHVLPVAESPRLRRMVGAAVPGAAAPARRTSRRSGVEAD